MREDELRTDVPHTARIWSYWLGGKDNCEAPPGLFTLTEKRA